MTDISLSPDLLAVRRDLLAATMRDVEQRRLRHHPVRAIALALVVIIAMSGVAMAASPKFARTVTDAGTVSLETLGIFERRAKPVRAAPDPREPELSAEGSAAIAQLTQVPRGEIPEQMYQGANVAGKGRLAVALRDGDYDFHLYVTLTAKGRICAMGTLGPYADRTGSGAGGCIRQSQLSATFPVSTIGQTPTTDRILLSGVVTDDVRAVRLVTALGTEPAVMGENAYAWLAPDVDHPPIAMELVLRDGTVLRRDTPQYVTERAQGMEIQSCERRMRASGSRGRNADSRAFGQCMTSADLLHPMRPAGPVVRVTPSAQAR